MTTRAPILIAGPTASGKSALAPCLGRAPRRRDDQRRLDAGLSRAAGAVRPPPAEAETRRVPHSLYGHTCRARRPIPQRGLPAEAAAMPSKRRELAGTGADRGWRHGALFHGADSRACRPIPAVPDDIRDALAQPGGRDRRRGAAMPSSRTGTRSWPARLKSDGSAAPRSARSRFWTRRVSRWPSGSRSRASRCVRVRRTAAPS